MIEFPSIFTATALIVCIWLAVFVIVSRIYGQFKSPRGRKRFHRRLMLWISLPTILAGVGWQVANGQVTMATLGLAVAAAAIAWRVLSMPTEQFTQDDAVANYATDRRHCGQCEYDLTGNESGVCPECGWQIPQHMPAEHVPWAMWWKRWRIEHLDNWQKTLWGTVCAALGLAGMAIVMLLALHSLPGAVIGGLMCLMFLVNTGRVIAYGRRQGQS